MNQMNLLSEELLNKWKPILEHDALPKIGDRYKKGVTAVVLENTEKALREAQNLGVGQSLLSEDNLPVNNMGDGNVSTFDPILISLVRRTLPNLIAYDLCGVQPMTGPTGLIFALRPRYSNQTGTESWYNEVNTGFSTITAGNTSVDQAAGNLGSVPGISNNAGNSTYNASGAMPTAQAEALGTTSNASIAEMAFSIDKTTVTARSRALKAEYTLELAQDLKAIHGLDAETELSNILSAEILSEMNREIIRVINIIAKPGAQLNTTTPGQFDLDTDSNGRWMVEKFKGLVYAIERDCNQIAKQTRRGKGNIMICSSDVASALTMTGLLSYTPAYDAQLQVDDTGSTFAGILNGRMRVYIDPYTTGQYITVGYRGPTPFDAGLFYCPYVPLQMLRAVDPQSLQPKIGFKTRYGVVANPYAEGLTEGAGALNQDSNVYYRRIIVQNLL